MSPSSADYVQRVNRAIDYITHNLAADLQLDEVAKVACFSSFHFHRLFKQATGETLLQFVKRTRLERALHQMSRQPSASLTDIALAVGFASSSDFSRSFKQRYGVPPSAFDIKTFRARRREEWTAITRPPDHITGLPAGKNADGFAISIREAPARTVAYLRVADPYRSNGVMSAARELISWADERGLSEGQWLGYQWDDPDLVPVDKCRYDVGVEVPERTPVDGRVGRQRFEATTLAELAIDGGIELEMRALDWMFHTWLPQSGYLPADQPCFEAWQERPFADGYQRFRLRLQLPITKA